MDKINCFNKSNNKIKYSGENYDLMREHYKDYLLFEKKYTIEIRKSSLLEEEIKANRIFNKLKNFTQTYKIEENFHLNAVDYFSRVKSLNLYELIHKMPKGGLLHHHLIVHGGSKYYSDILSQEEFAYANLKEEIVSFLHKGQEIPQNYNKIKGNINITPEQLKSLFIFSKMDKQRADYWTVFGKKIMNMKEVCCCTKYFKNYLLKTFNDCIEEGILIYQGRHMFGLVNEYGKTSLLKAEKELDIILEALEEVRKRENCFQANFIFCAYRHWDLEKISEELKKCLELKKMKEKYDDIILGFDLVGDELLKDSKDFAWILNDFKQKADNGKHLPFNFYLHAGEVLSSTNDNLIDSILLKTPRIGHCTNLINHLYLIDDIKQNNICLECNPLSNQILNYIRDLREHPAKFFLDAGLIVTINSDDDGAFDTESFINFDYFISAVSMNFDLFDFKQIILNSINYSGIMEEKINIVKNEFFLRWNHFIKYLCDLDSSVNLEF